ncbi:MAG: D-ribose pyranase [Ruthenibacterium sp.]
MKKDRVLNPALIASIAAIGHTEYFVIADCGLPIPEGVPVIDLTLVRGIPKFTDTLRAVCDELVVESYVLASEMEVKSSALYSETKSILQDKPNSVVPHEEFKKLTQKAKVIVRTGETTSYANIILVAGVNF